MLVTLLGVRIRRKSPTHKPDKNKKTSRLIQGSLKTRKKPEVMAAEQT